MALQRELATWKAAFYLFTQRAHITAFCCLCREWLCTPRFKILS